MKKILCFLLVFMMLFSMGFTDVSAKTSHPADSKIVHTYTAEEVNNWWRTEMGYTSPPYLPHSTVYELELTDNVTFARVYDGVISGMYGGWLMDYDAIKGLTASEIRDKFALPATPQYMVSVALEKGTHLRSGITNAASGWGNGGGLQYDLMGQRIGQFIHPVPLLD